METNTLRIQILNAIRRKLFHKQIGTTRCPIGNPVFQELLIWNKIPSSVRSQGMSNSAKRKKSSKTYSSRLTRWVDRLLPFDSEIFHAPGKRIGIALAYLSRHPSQIEGESVKAKELCNNWFTVNHVNNVNSILAEEFNRAIRGRQWLKLRREDKHSKSEQTHETHDNRQRTRLAKMGQNNSTDSLAGNRNSKQFESKLDLANKCGKNMLIAKDNDDENLQNLIKIVKNPSKAKIKALESPWRERFKSIAIDENNLL